MSLSDALFTPSQAQVWAWVFGQPERRFHFSELLRLTGLGSASLQREIGRLVDAGLLTSEPVGNLRCVQANPHSPVFAEVLGITRKALGAVPQLQTALAPLASQLQGAWIFGSVAKGTDTAHSDIDLLLVGDLTLAQAMEHTVPVEERLGRKISPTLYTPAEFAQRLADSDSFVSQVMGGPLLALLPSAPGGVAPSAAARADETST